MKAHVFISVLAFHVVIIAGLYLLSACSSSSTGGPTPDQTDAGSSTGGSIYDQYAAPNRPVEDDSFTVTRVDSPEQNRGSDPAFNSGSNAYSSNPSSSGGVRSQPRRPSDGGYGAQGTPVLNEFVEEEVLQPLVGGNSLTPSVEYQVEKGDSLWKISKEFGISLKELLQANGLSESSTIQVGQNLVIPSLTAGPPSPTVSSSAGESEVYTVVSGDTLSRIAKQFNSSVNDIKVANGLPSDVIQLNQRLTIPVNSLASNPPRSVPARVAPAPSVAPAQSTAGIAQGDIVHVVQSGETPGVIARQYGITTTQLMTDNAIVDARKIRVGQKLQIRLGVAQPAASSSIPTTTQPASRPVSTPTLFDDSVFQNLDNIPEVEVVPRS